jgi:hypothetical protein
MPTAVPAREVRRAIEPSSNVAERIGSEATDFLHRIDFDVADDVREDGYACNNENNCYRANHEISHVTLLTFL